MSRRGFISFVFDGRYKFARYYAPDNFNTPIRWKRCSPTTRSRCSTFKPTRTSSTISASIRRPIAPDPAMNELLNRMIAREVGVNDGGFLPAVLRTPAPKFNPVK